MGPLWPYQEDLVQSNARELVVVSSTQIGKTHACASWLLTQAWLAPGTMNWWAAPTHKQARIGYRTIRRMARAAGILVNENKSEGSLTIGAGGWQVFDDEHDSIIEFRSWERDENLLGETVWATVVDEAGLLTPEARAIISSRRSATLGPARYIGNPGPTGAAFWLLCQQAQEAEENPESNVIDGRPLFAFKKWWWETRYEALNAAGCREAAERYKAFIDSERIQDAVEFARLYEAEFAIPKRAIFAKHLKRIAVAEPSTTPHEGHSYVVGWDIGLEQDWTVGIPLCLDCFTVTDMVRLRPGDSTGLPKVIADYSQKWNGATAVIEVNGPGKPLFDKVTAIYPNAQKWFTDNPKKRAAVMEVVQRAQSVPDPSLTIHPDKTMIQELRVFQSKQNMNTGIWTFAAPEGSHDDVAMALIIAVGAATSGAAAYLNMMRRQLAAQKRGKGQEEKRGAA